MAAYKITWVSPSGARFEHVAKTDGAKDAVLDLLRSQGANQLEVVLIGTHPASGGRYKDPDEAVFRAR